MKRFVYEAPELLLLCPDVADLIRTSNEIDDPYGLDRVWDL